MDHYTFNAYAFAVRHAFGPDAGIVAIVDTSGPGTLGAPGDRPADVPYLGSHLDPVCTAVAVVVDAAGGPVRVAPVVGYARHGAGVATLARVIDNGPRCDTVADAVRVMGDVAAMSDLDYVTA